MVTSVHGMLGGGTNVVSSCHSVSVMDFVRDSQMLLFSLSLS